MGIHSLLLILAALSALPIRAEVLPAKAIKASAAMVSQWKKDCTKGKGQSCYNLGVYFAQDVDDEKQACGYYEQACKAKDGLGCFNLAGLLIKDKTTRSAGADAFSSACAISKDSKQSAGIRQAIGISCAFSDIVRKNADAEYDPLIQKLGAAHQ